MIKVPFFSNTQKWWVGPLGIAAFVVLYMIPNHIHLFEPQTIYMFGFEPLIPFIDWSVFVYMSDYLYIGLVFFLLKERENMNKIYYSQILMLLFAMVVFTLYPTSYPRPIVEYYGFTGKAVQLLHSLDTPCNALPSLHVGITFLAGFGFVKEQKKLLPLFMLWAVLISLSTLTLKQHYALDVISGFLMSVVFYKLGSLIRDRREWMEILTFPNELLRRKSKEVELENDLEKKELISNVHEMTELMYEANGIGLAAPQVGIAKRFFIIDVEQTVERDEDDNVIARKKGNLHVFINPKIVSKEGDVLYEEGCLSVPGIYEDVKRAQKVTVEYYDYNFEKKQMIAEGLMAIAIQHENDHLDGKLFIDKLSVVKRTMIKNKISKGKTF